MTFSSKISLVKLIIIEATFLEVLSELSHRLKLHLLREFDHFIFQEAVLSFILKQNILDFCFTFSSRQVNKEL